MQGGSMANGGTEEPEKPSASIKSPVWEHFSFPISYTDDKGGTDDERGVVDRTVMECLHCEMTKM